MLVSSSSASGAPSLSHDELALVDKTIGGLRKLHGEWLALDVQGVELGQRGLCSLVAEGEIVSHLLLFLIRAHIASNLLKSAKTWSLAHYLEAVG